MSKNEYRYAKTDDQRPIDVRMSVGMGEAGETTALSWFLKCHTLLLIFLEKKTFFS